MESSRVLFAHGNSAMPRIVSSLERAKELALADAKRNGAPEPILAVDLQHPDRPVRVLGLMYPDGSYHDA